MPQIHYQKILPYSREQLFDLVMDIEKYPDFLPWCSEAKIIKKTENEIIGRLGVQKGLFNKTFTTRNDYSSPNYIKINLLDGPFKKLEGNWDFKALPEGCLITYVMDFEVPFFLNQLLTGVAQYMGSTMVEAFSARAEKIYGKTNN